MQIMVFVILLTVKWCLLFVYWTVCNWYIVIYYIVKLYIIIYSFTIDSEGINRSTRLSEDGLGKLIVDMTAAAVAVAVAAVAVVVH